MRLAVITDAHANLPALRAALAEIRRIGVDAVYHTGDAIGIGRSRRRRWTCSSPSPTRSR